MSQAFLAAQNALQADSLLVHYDPAKPIVLACDASQCGIGAVLSHVVDNEQDRPIAYVSRTLSPAEKNYSQLEKEALAIVFAVKKFHNFIYGRLFLIESDHRPLMFLFGDKSGIPPLASSRIQRWALTLSTYTYTIRYRAGKKIGHVDALSRLPRPVSLSSETTPADLIFLTDHLSATCISAHHIKQWTSQDPVLSCVHRFILTGWPERDWQPEFRPYFSKRYELSVFDRCILRASRIVVPPPGRDQVLQELHETHSGVSKMKSLARAYIWWPDMDSQIEQLVNSCPVCQESRPSPPAAPLHPWEWPSQPWSRIHIDYFGPFRNHMFMVIVNAHSKWIDACVMSSITSAKTIEQLRIIFHFWRVGRSTDSDVRL